MYVLVHEILKIDYVLGSQQNRGRHGEFPCAPSPSIGTASLTLTSCAERVICDCLRIHWPPGCDLEFTLGLAVNGIHSLNCYFD